MSTESDEIKVLITHSLPTMVWPLRTPKDPVSFYNEFQVHIRDKFRESSSTKYTRELNEFANLRNVAISTLSENSIRDNNSLQVLRKYYCQLSAMLTRFKGSAAVFTWKDSFGRGSNSGDLEFEINNIMYNIAGIHNEFGAKITRNSDSSDKDALIHFTSALWWTKELRDNRSGLKTKEMGHDLLTSYFHILQAEAQECVLFKMIREGKKPDLVAKICSQITSDYDIALKLSQAPLYTDPIKEIIGASVFVSWRAMVEFKLNYFSAIKQLLLGLSFSDDNAKDIAMRVARLKWSSQLVEACRKIISEAWSGQTTKTAFDNLSNLVTRKLDKAIRYNDNVYHSTIPARETLPTIEPILLVSPLAYEIPRGSDLFSNLITIESVQVSSIYSQKKDDLSRDIKTKVEKQDEELAHMMSTLNFDEKSLVLPSFNAPDDLIELCAELSMNPNIVDDVLTKLEDLDDKSEEIQKMLDNVQEMLKRRPNKQFEEKLKRLTSTHEDALRTSQTLHKQLYPELQQKIQLLATTNNPQELLPKVNTTSEEDEQVIRQLSSVLRQVRDLKEERADLLSKISRSLNQDDVIKSVVAAASEAELKNIFDKEIQKHNIYLEPLMDNLKKQNNILDTLERLNAQYGQVKLNHRSKMTSYNEKVEGFKKFYNQFKATSEGIDQGLDYHKKMVEVVRNFYNEVGASTSLKDLLN